MAHVDPRIAAIVAHQDGVSAEVRRELRGRAARVQAVVDAHVRTGALKAGTRVATDTTDSTVSMSDPNVLSINYGHTAADGTWVEGIHAIEQGMR